MSGPAVRVGNGGWVLYRAPDPEVTVYVRVEEADDGRLEIADMFLPFEAPPDATMFRSLAEHVRRIGAAVNSGEVGQAVRNKLDLPGPDLRTAAEHFGHSFGTRADHWVARMFRAQIAGSDEPVPRGGKRRDVGVTVGAANPAVQSPSTRPYPESFYEHVARVYESVAAESDRPSVVIAEASRVPPATVRSWVAQARERGHLRPGRRGRAG